MVPSRKSSWRKQSAAARARERAGMEAYWAAVHSGARKRRARRQSAAARAREAAGMRAYWARHAH